MKGRIVTQQKIQDVLTEIRNGKSHNEIKSTLHVAKPTIIKIINGEYGNEKSKYEERMKWEAEFKKDWEEVCSRLTRRKRK